MLQVVISRHPLQLVQNTCKNTVLILAIVNLEQNKHIIESGKMFTKICDWLTYYSFNIEWENPVSIIIWLLVIESRSTGVNIRQVCFAIDTSCYLSSLKFLSLIPTGLISLSLDSTSINNK